MTIAPSEMQDNSPDPAALLAEIAAESTMVALEAWASVNLIAEYEHDGNRVTCSFRDGAYSYGYVRRGTGGASISREEAVANIAALKREVTA